MRRLLIVATTLLSMLLTPVMASAATPGATLTWDMRGQYTMDFVCPGCVPHYLTITHEDFQAGTFSGTGYYTADPSYTWDVTGTVTGNTFTMHILYTGTNPGYHVDVTGSIARNGALSGTATDGYHGIYGWMTTHRADRVVITPRDSIVSRKPERPLRPILQR